MASEKFKQVVTPRKRNSRSTKSIKSLPPIDWEKVRNYSHIALKISAVIGCLAVIAVLYNRVVSLPAFHLRNVEVSGNSRISSAEIEKAIKNNLSSALFATNLKKIQTQLQSFVWIKKAQVIRILPDTLRIRVEERKPLILVRFEDEQIPVWMDEEAVILGEYDHALDKELPPLATGFLRETVASTQAENLDKVSMYKQLMTAFDGGPKKFSPLIEEIDLSNLKDIRVQLSEGSVEVDLGDRDFRARLTRALDILLALRNRDLTKLKDYKLLDPQILQQAEQIRFISVVHPTQIAIRSAKSSQNKEATQKNTVAQKER